MAQLKKNPPIIFDYKDVKTLQRYINVYGQIEPISKTGLSEKQQRSLAVAIKRARHLALLPFVSSNQERLMRNISLLLHIRQRDILLERRKYVSAN